MRRKIFLILCTLLLISTSANAVEYVGESFTRTNKTREIHGVQNWVNVANLVNTAESSTDYTKKPTLTTERHWSNTYYVAENGVDTGQYLNSSNKSQEIQGWTCYSHAPSYFYPGRGVTVSNNNLDIRFSLLNYYFEVSTDTNAEEDVKTSQEYRDLRARLLKECILEMGKKGSPSAIVTGDTTWHFNGVDLKSIAEFRQFIEPETEFKSCRFDFRLDSSSTPFTYHATCSDTTYGRPYHMYAHDSEDSWDEWSFFPNPWEIEVHCWYTYSDTVTYTNQVADIGSIERLSFSNCGGTNASFSGSISQALDISSSNLTSINFNLKGTAPFKLTGGSLGTGNVVNINGLTVNGGNVGTSTFSLSKGDATITNPRGTNLTVNYPRNLTLNGDYVSRKTYNNARGDIKVNDVDGSTFTLNADGSATSLAASKITASTTNISCSANIPLNLDDFTVSSLTISNNCTTKPEDTAINPGSTTDRQVSEALKIRTSSATNINGANDAYLFLKQCTMKNLRVGGNQEVYIDGGTSKKRRRTTPYENYLKENPRYH